MKKNEVKVGGVYSAKVSDKVVEVRIDAENRHGGWDATNLATNKKVRIKTAQRLRAVAGGEAAEPATPAEPDAPAPEAPKAKKTRKAKQADAPVAAGNGKKVSCLDAAARVLTEAGEPLNAKQMIDAMYVDKVLSDIKAVQTLSRLNRAHPKKHNVFVLDFQNDTETIETRSPTTTAQRF